MSLAVGETHGTNRPEELPTPKGLNRVLRRGREEVRPFQGRGDSGTTVPWVSPTANDIVPLQGTDRTAGPTINGGQISN